MKIGTSSFMNMIHINEKDLLYTRYYFLKCLSDLRPIYRASGVTNFLNLLLHRSTTCPKIEKTRARPFILARYDRLIPTGS